MSRFTQLPSHYYYECEKCGDAGTTWENLNAIMQGCFKKCQKCGDSGLVVFGISGDYVLRVWDERPEERPCGDSGDV